MGWLPHLILRTASLIAPGDERADFVRGWRSELWYVPAQDGTLFCLGAFRDALYLRRNQSSRSSLYPESPISCLFILAILAAVSLSITVQLPAPQGHGELAHIRVGDVWKGCVSMLLLFVPVLTATYFTMGWSAANRPPTPWRGRLRQGIFLVLKIGLLQPVMFAAFMTSIAAEEIPLAPSLGLWILWGLSCRWVLADQARRCPMCLRLLTNPVRIGTPSRTFLEWYGAESTCSRGHGLLHTSEVSRKAQWLSLGASWSGLFKA
jgi:hypothetical protein